MTIEELVRECHRHLASAESRFGKGKEYDRSLYHCLSLAYSILDIIRKYPARKKALRRLLKTYKIRESREDAIKYTELLKLCFNDKDSKRINVYGSALYYAEDQRWSPKQFENELNKRGGVSALAKCGRELRDRKEGPRRTVKERPRVTAETYLQGLEPLGTVDIGDELSTGDPVVLLGRGRAGGSADVLCSVKVDKSLLDRLLAAVARDQKLDGAPTRKKRPASRSKAKGGQH